MRYSIIRSIGLIASIILIALAASGCVGSNTIIAVNPTAVPDGAAGQSGDLTAGLPGTLDYSIEIVGGTHSPTTLKYADIKGLGLVEKDHVSYLGDDGLEYTGDFAGVPMDAILARAGLSAGNLTYNVSAADGDYMIYTQAQADKAILGLKQNGTALSDNIHDSPIHMVLPGGPYCHWIDLPEKIEIISDSPAGYCVPYTSSDSMNRNNSSMG